MFEDVCSEVKDDAVAQFLKTSPDMTFTMAAVDLHGRYGGGECRKTSMQALCVSVDRGGGV